MESRWWVGNRLARVRWQDWEMIAVVLRWNLAWWAVSPASDWNMALWAALFASDWNMA